MVDIVSVVDEKDVAEQVEEDFPVASGGSAVKGRWRKTNFYSAKFTYLEPVPEAGGERHSPAWNYFEEFWPRLQTGERFTEKGAKNLRIARCKLSTCNHRELILRDASTRTMRGHLESVHKMNMEEVQKESSSTNRKRKDLSRGSCFCPECMRDEYSSSESFDGPIAPKRAQSAYFLWFAKNCDSIREKGMTATEVAQKAGQMWSELDRDAKQKFVKAAEEDRKRCAHETKEYRIMCESKKSKKLKTSAPKSPPPKRRWLYSDPDEASTTPEKGTPKRRVESDFDVGFTNRTKSGVKTRTGLLDESLRTAVAEEVANQLQPIVESAVAAAVKAATEQFANFFEKLAGAAYNVRVATDNLQKVCAGSTENSTAFVDNSAAEEEKWKRS